MNSNLLAVNQIEKGAGLSLGTLQLIHIDSAPAIARGGYSYISKRNHVALDQNGAVVALNLASNNLSESNLDFLQHLKDLRLLDLSGNKIQRFELPDSLSKLEYLDLSENDELLAFDLSVEMPNLSKLLVYNTNLQKLELPSFCPKLQHIEARKSAIKEIVFGQDCPALESVDVSYNDLEELDLSGNFPKLKYFSARNNRISKLLWAEIIPNLEILNLDHNLLKSLPDELAGSLKIHMLFLFDNPLDENFRSLIGRSQSSDCHLDVLNQIRELSKAGSQTVLNREVRLILLGNPTMGKTALARALIENRYIREEEENIEDSSTHGIQLREWRPEDTEGLVVKIWDFGGQEYYHATHKLFLSQNAVFAVVCTHESDGPNRQDVVRLKTKIVKSGRIITEEVNTQVYPLVHWFDTVDFFRKKDQRQSFMIVQNKIDQCPKDYDLYFDNLHSSRYSSLEKITIDGSFDENNPVPSAKRNWKAFKDKLIGLLEDNLDGSRMIPEWATLRAKISDLRSANKYYITWSEYEKLAESIYEKFGERPKEGGRSTLERATLYFHSTGELLWFENEPQLRDKVFLHPGWLTGKIYEILNYDVLESEGQIDVEECKRSLGPEFGMDILDWLLQVMQEFHLLFQPKDSHGVLIAPQYLPDIKIILSKRTLAANALRKLYDGTNHYLFSLKLTKSWPKSVIVQIISRFGRYAVDSYWKNGVIFEYGDSAPVKIRIEESSSLNKIDFYSDGKKQIGVHAYLVDEMREILQRNEDVRISLDQKNYVLLEELLRRMERGGIDSIDTEEGEDGYVKLELFDALLKKESGKSDFARTIPKTSISLETKKRIIAISYSHNNGKYDDIEVPVNELTKILRENAVYEVKMDRSHVGTKNFFDFAREMAGADKYVVFFSRKFAESLYCMYEICYAYHHRGWEKNETKMIDELFQVKVDDLDLYTPGGRSEIIRFWMQTKAEEANFYAYDDKEAYDFICKYLGRFLGNAISRVGGLCVHSLEEPEEDLKRFANRILAMDAMKK
jgi:Leucine-rich repeat (LRR) protein